LISISVPGVQLALMPPAAFVMMRTFAPSVTRTRAGNATVSALVHVHAALHRDALDALGLADHEATRVALHVRAREARELAVVDPCRIAELVGERAQA
jgi:hypothetical protein